MNSSLAFELASVDAIGQAELVAAVEVAAELLEVPPSSVGGGAAC